jgi:transaldolase
MLKSSPREWNRIILEKRKKYTASRETLFRAVYYEILKRGAEKLMPLFEYSNGSRGHISGQVGSETLHDSSSMIEMAEEIADISPNMMVKIPATSQGLPVLEKLASKGISTNTTLAYSVSQILAASEAVNEGRKQYLKRNPLPKPGWRAVCTHMSGRFEDSSLLAGSLQKKGIQIDSYELRTASEAIIKKSADMISQRKHPVKLLGSSQRIHVDGNVRSIPHVEMFAGGPIVFTFAPHILETIFLDYRGKPFKPNWSIPPDQIIISRLMESDYFRRGYEEDGYKVDEFDSIEPLIENEKEFRTATAQMMEYIDGI